MKVSFIVPVYKAEAYLHQCVSSLANQTYKEIEIILVDDGSPDRSPEVCDALAVNDSRIKVLHKENGGLSDARNAGLSIAKGEYIVFIDGDDFWVRNDALQILMEAVSSHPECSFIGFNCSYYYPHSDSYSRWVEYDALLAQPSSASKALCLLVESGTVPMSACLKIISREWLLKAGLSFKKKQLSEDIPWFIHLLDRSECCMFINQYIYAYRQGVPGSITGSFTRQNFDDILSIIRQEIMLLDSRKFTEESKNALRSFLAYELSILISKLFTLSVKDRSVRRKELLAYRWLLDYTANPKVKMVSRVNRMFGMRVTEWMLTLYEKYRSGKLLPVLSLLYK